MAYKSKKTLKRDEIRQDLLDQLERNGTVGKHYIDMIEDYMTLWDIKNGLEDDIKERGAAVPYVTMNGTVNIKKNESVGELIKVNAQMLKIMDALGVKPEQGDILGEEM